MSQEHNTDQVTGLVAEAERALATIRALKENISPKVALDLIQATIRLNTADKRLQSKNQEG